MVRHFIPTLLSILTAGVLLLLLVLTSQIINFFPVSEKIKILLIPADILIGITIYLKTSVDFAFAIGNLIKKYSGIKNQTIISVMTSLANGIGTILVLIVWVIFRQNTVLLAIMLFVAAIALVHMASEGLRESPIVQRNVVLRNLQLSLHRILSPIYALFAIFHKDKALSKKTESSIILISFSLPFLLGLDDFAGYIPLFTLVNVVSFATGVILGHLILIILLFIKPETTRRIMSHPWIEIIGSLVFLGLGILGLIEMVKLIVLPH